jgi:predicted nucleotidyltransferase
MDYLNEVKKIVLAGLRGHPARVYLFGSRAHGDAVAGSDIDVAVLPADPLPPGLLSLIREQLEESHVPYVVELVDLSDADPAFRQLVQQEGTLWTG